MKAVYIADDGKHFEDYQECVEYEKNIQLERHIDRVCGTVYDDDFGYSVINSITVAAYIRDNIDEILEILKGER